MWIILIILILVALVILTGVFLALAAGVRYALRFNFRLPLLHIPENEYFSLLRRLAHTSTLWDPCQGNLPDPSGEPSVPEIHNQPME